MARGRRRYATLGDTAAMIVPEARVDARRLIAALTETARNDGGPSTPGQLLTAFAEEFLERYARHWKPATREASTYVVRKHILPAFDHMTVDAIAVASTSRIDSPPWPTGPAAPTAPCPPCRP